MEKAPEPEGEGFLDPESLQLMVKDTDADIGRASCVASLQKLSFQILSTSASLKSSEAQQLV